jgi:hypothetical protein
MDELLFHNGDLRASLELQGKKMRAAVEGEADESLAQTDADEWAAALAHHFAVACPALKADGVWMEPVKEVGVDVSRDPSRDFSDYASELARNFPGNRIVVHVPFEGDAGVFGLKTSSSTTTKPRGRVQGSDVLLTIEYARDVQPNIGGRVDGFVNEVDRYLGWAREQIDQFNAALEQEALRAIEARRLHVQQRDAHIAESGIPVRRPGESMKTYIPDVIVRRPAPSLPKTRADEKAPKLEPALEGKVYEHILEVMRMHARQMEHSPGAYAQLGEEDRRQQIVATLNTHYAGRAAAEAFNNQGKTDILIRFEGKNIFICECKFWEGPEGFDATIAQLFRYVGWRDTKLAIVMFVREKGLTTILKRARTTLSKHEQFVSWGSPADETELRATMHWPGDEKRHADLNVFFVHTPLRRAPAAQL